MREPEEGKLIGTAAENLVIGGGLAGGMVGLRLAATGKQVLLLEKEGCAHHKVCGEFLSAEAVAYLRQAGVDPVSLGAVPIEAVRLSARDRAVERRLPFRALSLSRDVLDAALLGRAEEEGCMVRRGTAAVGLSRMGENWTAELADGTAVHARRVFLATGKHDLRGWSRPPGVQGDLVGFKLHWSLSGAEEMALRGRMELFLFSGGYGGLALVENHTANLCLVVGRAQLRKLGGWEEVLESLLGANAHIRRFLEGAQPLWQRPLAISSIPYGYMSRRSGGPWCVGDQAAVIPSFTGDGMAIALHSGALAVEMSLAGETADEYHRVLEGQLKKGMWVATALSRAMVSSAGRKMAPLALALLPGAIGWIAKSTRIPDTAMNLLCDAKSRFS